MASNFIYNLNHSLKCMCFSSSQSTKSNCVEKWAQQMCHTTVSFLKLSTWLTQIPCPETILGPMRRSSAGLQVFWKVLHIWVYHVCPAASPGIWSNSQQGGVWLLCSSAATNQMKWLQSQPSILGHGCSQIREIVLSLQVLAPCHFFRCCLTTWAWDYTPRPPWSFFPIFILYESIVFLSPPVADVGFNSTLQPFTALPHTLSPPFTLVSPVINL